MYTARATHHILLNVASSSLLLFQTSRTTMASTVAPSESLSLTQAGLVASFERHCSNNVSYLLRARGSIGLCLGVDRPLVPGDDVRSGVDAPDNLPNSDDALVPTEKPLLSNV